jgi:hypothetical protein
VERIDPAELDFESFARLQTQFREPAWRAAAAHGVDLFLLEQNLELTPAERMQQHEELLRLMGR